MGFLAAAAPFIGTALGIGGSLLNKNKGQSATTQSSGSSNTTSTREFDPFTMELMRSLQGQGARVLGDYMQNPWAAGFFNQQQSRASEGTGQRAEVMRRNLLNPAFMAAGGASNPSAFMASQQAAIGRNASRERADSFVDLLGQAENLRRGAAGGALAYQPLQTGASGTSQEQQTSTESAKKGSIWGDLLSLGGNALMSLPKKQSTTAPLPFMSGPMF